MNRNLGSFGCPILGLAVLVATISSCSPGDSATQPELWTIVPPQGTVVHDYDLPEGEAGVRLEVDLIYGTGNAPGEQLNRPADIAVDDEGRVYVLDSGDRHVLVFGVGGELVMTLGGEGAGPGEFGRPSQLAVTNDRVFVQDMQHRRISIWTLDGSHIGETSLPPGDWYEEMHGTRGGRILAVQPHRSYEGISVKRFVLLDQNAREIEERYVLAPRHDAKLRSNINEPYLEGLIASVNDRTQPTPDVAVHRSGSAYITDAISYQVHAADASGKPRWSLRAHVRPGNFPEEEIDRVVAMATKKVPMRRSWIEWPDQLPAIARLATDGEGRLYVFPFHYFDPMDQPVEVPVHVYAENGEHLLAGSIPAVEWGAALGDYVYSKRLSPESNEWEVVRWRLELPAPDGEPAVASR